MKKNSLRSPWLFAYRRFIPHIGNIFSSRRKWNLLSAYWFAFLGGTNFTRYFQYPANNSENTENVLSSFEITLNLGDFDKCGER